MGNLYLRAVVTFITAYAIEASLIHFMTPWPGMYAGAAIGTFVFVAAITIREARRQNNDNPDR